MNYFSKGDPIDVLISSKLLLIKMYSTMGVRRPVCPHIYLVLGSFLKVEKYPASENAEKAWAAESEQCTYYKRVANGKSIRYDDENYDEYRSQKEVS